MNNSGWIKSYRSLLDWEWWEDQAVTRLWLTILLSVNHDRQKWRGRVIEAGQMVTSYASLSKKSGLSIQSVRTSLNKLKSTGEITCKSTHQNTLITVVKWAEFQADDRITNTPINTQVNTQPTYDQHTTNIRPTTNKNDKNDKNEKNIEYLTILSLFNETCPSYPRVKSLSEDRKKAIRARLNKYTLDDFKQLFEKAEASDFLKGANSKNWSATFDWLIRDRNMPKVLEGTYDNKARKENKSDDNSWNFTDFIYGGGD